MTNHTDVSVEDVQGALQAQGIATTEAEIASILRNIDDPEALLMWRADFVDAVLAVEGVDPDGYQRDRVSAARDGYEWS